MSNARDWLRDRIGSTVSIDGQDFTLVGVEGGTAVLENEDERIMRIGLLAAKRRVLRMEIVSALIDLAARYHVGLVDFAEFGALNRAQWDRAKAEGVESLVRDALRDSDRFIALCVEKETKQP